MSENSEVHIRLLMDEGKKLLDIRRYVVTRKVYTTQGITIPHDKLGLLV